MGYSNKTTVSRIEAKLDTMKIANAENLSISKGLKVVTLPLPTNYFTGRDEHLRTIEASFGLPKRQLNWEGNKDLYFTGQEEWAEHSWR